MMAPVWLKRLPKQYRRGSGIQRFWTMRKRRMVEYSTRRSWGDNNKK
jgi:hypothetical protein